MSYDPSHKSNAYYRWFPRDYRTDTAHLGWLEDLAYRRLIDLYHIHDRPIPLDRDRIMRLVGASQKEQMDAVDTVLAEFFERKPDGWHQKRCDAEMAWRDARAVLASMAATRRWKKTTNENNGSSDADALPTQCGRYAIQNQSQSQSKREERKTPSESKEKTDARPEGARQLPEPRTSTPKTAGGTRLPADWAPDPALLAWAKQKRPDLDMEDTIASFRDYWVSQPGQRGVKLDWVATFRNWVRRETARPRPVNAAVAAGIPEWALGENPEPPPGTPRTKYQSDLGI